MVELSWRRAACVVLDLGQPLDLVALQGDERGDHDDRTVEELAATW